MSDVVKDILLRPLDSVRTDLDLCSSWVRRMINYLALPVRILTRDLQAAREHPSRGPLYSYFKLP